MQINYKDICLNWVDTTNEYTIHMSKNTNDIIVEMDFYDEHNFCIYHNWAILFYEIGISDVILEDVREIGLNDTVEWVGAKNFLDLYITNFDIYDDINNHYDEKKYMDYLHEWYNEHNEGCPVCFNEWYNNEYQEA